MKRLEAVPQARPPETRMSYEPAGSCSRPTRSLWSTSNVPLQGCEGAAFAPGARAKRLTKTAAAATQRAARPMER